MDLIISLKAKYFKSELLPQTRAFCRQRAGSEFRRRVGIMPWPSIRVFLNPEFRIVLLKNDTTREVEQNHIRIAGVVQIPLLMT